MDSGKNELEYSIDNLMERIVLKFKALTDEYEEYEIVNLKLIRERESLEKEKIELRGTISNISEELNKQNKINFDSINVNNKLKEQLQILKAKEDTLTKELQIREEQYSKEINEAITRCKSKEEERNNEMGNLVELHQKLLQDKNLKENELHSNSKRLISYIEELNEHRNLEKKRVEKVKEFTNIVDNLFDHSIKNINEKGKEVENSSHERNKKLIIYRSVSSSNKNQKKYQST